MLRKLLFGFAAVLISVTVLADTLKLRADAPSRYVVKKGDTLWDISGMFLDEPWLWPKLWRLNPEIENPHLIYPGDELRLVYDEQGQPMLVKTTKPSFKWSPKVRKEMKKQDAIAILPFEKIRHLVTYELMLTEQQIEQLPYVLGSDDAYLSSIEDARLYVNGDLALGESYAIYAKQDPIIDDDNRSGELIGYEVKLAGIAKVIRSGDMKNKVPATLQLAETKQEIRQGYLVMPLSQAQGYPALYRLSKPVGEFEGRITRSLSKVREVGAHNIVMLNKGIDDGVALGHIYTIARQSPYVIETPDGPVYSELASRGKRRTLSAQDIKIPVEKVGHLVVFKTYQQISFAMVMESNRSVRVEDLVNTQ